VERAAHMVGPWAIELTTAASGGRPDRWGAGSAPEKLWAPTTTDVGPGLAVFIFSADVDADADA
jgi:hypothetical protein